MEALDELDVPTPVNLAGSVSVVNSLGCAILAKVRCHGSDRVEQNSGHYCAWGEFENRAGRPIQPAGRRFHPQRSAAQDLRMCNGKKRFRHILLYLCMANRRQIGLVCVRKSLHDLNLFR